MITNQILLLLTDNLMNIIAIVSGMIVGIVLERTYKKYLKEKKEW